MRKFILITAMVLASATAQAGQSRNLSPASNNDEQPPVVATTTTPAPQPKAAEADTSNGTVASPQNQAPTPPTPPASPTPPAPPTFEARPPAVAPVATTPPASPPLVTPTTTTTTTTAAPPAKGDAPRKAAKAGKGRRGGHWSEARIIGELHRYGIYW
jgi:hypothetical protein